MQHHRNDRDDPPARDAAGAPPGAAREPLAQSGLGRRRFEHLVVELSLALGVPIPRWALWLDLKQGGADPESLSRDDALAFCESRAESFATACGRLLRPRAARRLRRAVGRFDPGQPTPYEHFSRLA